jgi:hypothetical protein
MTENKNLPKDLQCPSFAGGEEEDFKEWVRKVRLWQVLMTEEKRKYLGLLLGMKLGKEPAQLILDIPNDDLKKEDAVEKILERLETRYGEDAVSDKFNRVVEFLEIKKKSDESMRAYVHRFRAACVHSEKDGGGGFSDSVKGCMLLRAAELDASEKRLVLASMGTGEISWAGVEKSLIRMYPEKIEKNKNIIWMATAENRGGVRQSGMRSTNIVKGDRISTCFTCGSENHYARDCQGGGSGSGGGRFEYMGVGRNRMYTKV